MAALTVHVPTDLLANCAVPTLSVTASPLTTPASGFAAATADVVPSYVLSLALIPPVSDLARMLAVVLAVVLAV